MRSRALQPNIAPQPQSSRVAQELYSRRGKPGPFPRATAGHDRIKITTVRHLVSLPSLLSAQRLALRTSNNSKFAITRQLRMPLAALDLTHVLCEASLFLYDVGLIM